MKQYEDLDRLTPNDAENVREGAMEVRNEIGWLVFDADDERGEQPRGYVMTGFVNGYYTVVYDEQEIPSVDVYDEAGVRYLGTLEREDWVGKVQGKKQGTIEVKALQKGVYESPYWGYCPPDLGEGEFCCDWH